MKKYLVRVFIATVSETAYEIEAETKDQAAQEAIERYTKETDTWIQPKVQVQRLK
jgi:2',3'-cyclic-nucleotide 2'-phosphodiesterase (5'-nucleotidase family)